MMKRFDEFNELYWDGKIDHYQVKAVKPRARISASCDCNTRTILIDNNYTPETVDYLLLKMMCKINDKEHFEDEAKRIEEVSHGEYTASNIINPPLVIEGDKTLKVTYGSIRRGKTKSGKKITCRKVRINLIGKDRCRYPIYFIVEGLIEDNEMKMRSKDFAESLLDRRINTKGSYYDFIESINCNVKYNEEGYVIGVK